MGNMVKKMITDIISEKINATSFKYYDAVSFMVNSIEEYGEDFYGCLVDVSLDSKITSINMLVRDGEVFIETCVEDDIGEEFTELGFWRALFFFQ